MELPPEAHARLEAQLQCGVGRAVIAFSRLGFDLLMSLRSVMFPNCAPPEILAEDSLPTFDKLKKLRAALIKRAGEDCPLSDDLEEWFSRADRIRELRNFLVHGRFGISPVRGEICMVGGGTDALSGKERRFSSLEFEAVILDIESIC